MLAVSHRSSSALPSAHHRVMDESGTINPAALNASASTVAPNLLSQPSPRGIKRSRSPDPAEAAHSKEGESGAKRSRTVKSEHSTSRQEQHQHQHQQHHQQQQPLAPPPQPQRTPQAMTQALPQTPSQSSPQRSTPGSASKPAVVKALPTVRDHTTDQLGPGEDEYIPRETDSDGDTKVSKEGYPLDGRKYRCRTFTVPNRGEKLFMLATECARVLGYRDSYLLFNKNRSLYKIIANQAEKDDLIANEILPYSYRSRQIAIVTARSMFRQFGSRLIENGRRVRDDYWEAKAKKQGFTEEDAAGEKRPGAAKAREAAAAEASHVNALTSLPQGEVIYSNGPGFPGQPPLAPGVGPVSLAPLQMISLPSEDLRQGQYGGVSRPKQEAIGGAYQDRIASSTPGEILSQAGQAADFNKQLTLNREHRKGYLDDYWRREHEQPAQPRAGADAGTVAPRNLQSPEANANLGASRGQAESIQQPSSQMISQGYPGYSNPQNPMASPVQQMHRGLPPGQMHQSSPSISMASVGSGHRQTPSYNYPPNQMWQAPQPQPSPMQQQQQHPQQLPQYAQQQHHSPMPPPQMPQQSPMGYPQMGQMGNPAFAGMNRSMYQPNATPQQFAMGPQSGPGQQQSMQGWSTPGNANNMPPEWQRYQ
ncbi:hypothetical protein MBLNU230_g1180t1 [Neophaeotheca triangularis]